MSSNWTKLKRKMAKKKEGKRGRGKKPLDNTESVRIKKRYFRRFFYAFSIFFILFGLIGIVWFVYDQDPDVFGSSEKYYLLGVEAQNQSNLKKALEHYEKCLEIDPGKNEARLQAVLIYRSQGNYKKAEQLLSEGLSLQPRYEEYYRQMVYLLVEQNRVAEALDYLDGITTTYIVVKLNEERPSAIYAQTQPGIYASAQDIILGVPDGTTVYYTLDGTAPDLNSEQYVTGQPIRIEKQGTTNLRAVAINDAGMPSPEFDVAYRIYNENTKYEFKDSKIEKLVRAALGRPDGNLYYRDLEAITALDCSAADGSVAVLDDLLEMPNLETLSLDREKNIQSYEPLRRLGQLRSLSMDGCGLTDGQLPQIAVVIWLTSLSVEDNALTTLSPVASMLALTDLDASGNRIKTVPSVSRLSSLKNLDLSDNAINNLSWLSSHKTLNYLNLSDNLISDLTELSTCSALVELNLADNTFTSAAPLSGCSRLETLSISGSGVTNLSEIASLSHLSNLDVSHTKIESLDVLKSMGSLTSLNVSGTKVRDFSPLTGSVLKNLYASGCELEDLSTLASLGSLEVLDVSGNTVSDISVFALMVQLSVLNVSNNYVVDFSPLLNCDNLSSVNCKGCGLTAAMEEALTRKGIVVIK